MCVALISVVAAVASSLVGYAGQMANYKAQQQYYEQNAKAARVATVNRYASIQNRQLQEHDAAAQQVQQSKLEAMKARSTARTAAGEAGVTGLSVEALLQDLSAQEGRYEASVAQNYQMNQQYLRGEMEATQDQGIARINSVPYPTKPSFGAALIGAFGSGIQAYAQAT
jgi:hypothetical protein